MTKQNRQRPKIKQNQQIKGNPHPGTGNGKNPPGENPTDGLNWKLRSHILERDAITLLRALTQLAANVDLMQEQIDEAIQNLNDYNHNLKPVSRKLLRWNDGCVTDAQELLLEVQGLIKTAQSQSREVPLSKYLAEVVELIKN